MLKRPDGGRLPIRCIVNVWNQRYLPCAPSRRREHLYSESGQTVWQHWCGWPRPVWSPNGSQITYWDAQARLWVMTPDGQVRWPLVEPGEAVKYAAWSPDGSRLALRMRDRIMILTSTSLPQTSAAVVPTSDPEARASEYKDTWLCFNVEVLRVGLPMECPAALPCLCPGQIKTRLVSPTLLLKKPPWRRLWPR